MREFVEYTATEKNGNKKYITGLIYKDICITVNPE